MSTCPSEAGDHGRGEAMEPEPPAIAANPEERPPSVECEHALEAAEPAEAPNIVEGPRSACRRRRATMRPIANAG